MILINTAVFYMENNNFIDIALTFIFTISEHEPSVLNKVTAHFILFFLVWFFFFSVKINQADTKRLIVLIISIFLFFGLFNTLWEGLMVAFISNIFIANKQISHNSTKQLLNITRQQNYIVLKKSSTNLYIISLYF